MTSYPSFVTSRFKTLPTLAETLHHATTGMVGEAIELAYAPDRESMLKELGDFDFYLEALKQHAPVPLGCPSGPYLAFGDSKLLKRYPTGYSDAAAQNRADGEAERHG